MTGNTHRSPLVVLCPAVRHVSSNYSPQIPNASDVIHLSLECAEKVAVDVSEGDFHFSTGKKKQTKAKLTFLCFRIKTYSKCSYVILEEIYLL